MVAGAGWKVKQTGSMHLIKSYLRKGWEEALENIK